MDVGRKAENLIKEMMEELGFIVVPFGYEYLLPQFADRDNLLKGQAGELVRGQPDFLIVDKKTNYAYFIEVKYRKSEILDKKDISEYPEIFIILVSPNGILIANGEDIFENPEYEDCFRYLTEIGPFRNKNRNTLLKYVRKTKELFN